MSGNIKTIKFTAALSAIFALLTYVITLNIELSFFTPNLPWISNNFALTVCGGIFASTLVVMLCEVQKYLTNKANCENYLFYQAMYLYIALFLIQRSTQEYIDTPTETVPENLLEDNVQKAHWQLNAIQGTDYVAFSKKNKIVAAQHVFCSEVIPKIKSFLSADTYLKKVILTVEIADLKQLGKRKPVTTADPHILQALTVINKKSLTFLDNVSNYMKSIDDTCHHRFTWEVQKEKIHESYTSIFTPGNLDDFMKLEE